MKEVERRALAGEADLIGQMLEAWWNGSHACQQHGRRAGDFLNEKGFDTATETFREGYNAPAPASDPQSPGCAIDQG